MLHSGRLRPYLQTLTRLERFAKGKNPSLLQKFLNYGRKIFIVHAPSVTIKLFTVVSKSLLY
jgi:hypothetical protein